MSIAWAVFSEDSSLRAVEQERWSFNHQQDKLADVPGSTIQPKAGLGHGWILKDASGTEIREVDLALPPRWYRYIFPLGIPAASGAVVPWLLVNAIAWIVEGFRLAAPRE